MANVAEVLVDTLIANGVTRVWGLPGDSLNGVTDAIRTRRELSWMHVRNEEAAAFSAGAEAHISGRLAVCAGSCGPGNLHLINGLFDCYRSRVPVLAIAAQIPSYEMGTNYFQETRPEELFKDCSEYTAVITEPDQLERVLPIAMRTAIAKRSVAVLVIPGNIAIKHCESTPRTVGLLENDSEIVPSADALSRAAALMNEAANVAISGGAGCAGAHAELLAFADALKAPITHALRGKEYIEYENPFDVGMTGLLGFSSGYAAMFHADVLVILGSDFPYTQFFPKQARVIQVDSRQTLSRNEKLKIRRATADSLTDSFLPWYTAALRTQKRQSGRGRRMDGVHCLPTFTRLRFKGFVRDSRSRDGASSERPKTCSTKNESYKKLGQENEAPGARNSQRRINDVYVPAGSA